MIKSHSIIQCDYL